MKILNLLASHACDIIKISLNEQSFGLIDKYYAQKKTLRLYSEYSTNSRISPAAQIIISFTLGPPCVKHCNLTRLQRITGSSALSPCNFKKCDQKVTGNFQKWNNLHRRKLSDFMC